VKRDLLGLAELGRDGIVAILDLARELAPHATEGRRKRVDLAGRTVANLFFEASTRTRISFGLAARRLGADVIDYTASAGSTQKGETLVDTARNIEAMGVDVVVCRHAYAGAPHLLARRLRASVVNAGDGAHEHPTQGLLDAYTVREALGRVEGVRIALIGDIIHSRVARSALRVFRALGGHVTLIGPPTLVPRTFEKLGAAVSWDLDEVLPEQDVVVALRIQHERQDAGLIPSVREFARLYGIDARRLERMKPSCAIMHPGPVMRGVEVTSDVADSPRSLVLRQTTNGVAVRMAVLKWVLGPEGQGRG